MNPMMQALAQSRGSNPAPTGAPPVPGTPGAMPGNPGQMPAQPDPGMSQAMAKMSSDLADVSAKLDKLVEAISGQYKGTAEGSEPVEGEDGEKEEGSAKTFK